MPTKTEQSDINMLTRGGNGDFPHIVLAPGTVKECFEVGVLATNLSQLAQCPVLIALDAICHDSFTSDAFDLSTVEVEKGKRLSHDEVAQLEEYKRYLITDDGISPWAVPGTPGGMNLVTGNERDEWGRVSTDAGNRVKMMDKRSRKIDTVRPLLPVGVEAGDEAATIGIVATGILDGVISEAIERLALQGRSYRLHRPITLWPILDDTIEFINSHEKVFVVEQSEGAQLAALLRSEGANADRIVSILKYDGLQFTVRELIDALLAEETS
jgi:2-oxoglutarate ferredoxin oxidoreductase subunit alpha